MAGFILAFTLLFIPENAMAKDKINTLYVNGVDVLSCADMNDVLGDKTVSFDKKTGVLTLNKPAFRPSTAQIHLPYPINHHL